MPNPDPRIKAVEKRLDAVSSDLGAVVWALAEMSGALRCLTDVVQDLNRHKEQTQHAAAGANRLDAR